MGINSTLTPQGILNVVFDDVAKTRLTQARTLRNLDRYAMSTRKTVINWVVDKGGGGVAIESMSSDGAATTTDSTIPATLPIGNYRLKHQFTLNIVDVVEAMASAPDALKNLFLNHIMRGATHILREANRLIYAGTGSNGDGQVYGINYVADPTNVYAGINPATHTTWVPQVLTNATPRALTKSLLMKVDEAVSIAETGYDLILTHPATATKYNEVFDSYQSGSGVLAPQSVDERGFTRVDLGRSMRTYMGIPIVEDSMCPTGVMYFINSADFNLFSFNVGTDNKLSTVEAGEDAPVDLYGLQLFMGELPSNNTAARKFELFTIPQLRVFNRKSLTVLNQLTV